MSYKITFDTMFEEFKSENPGIADHIIDYYPSGQLELIAILRDGSRIRYDHRTRTTSRVPIRASTDGCMTEHEWRRAFAEKLRRRMFMKGLTQGELAEITGVSQVSISTYLSGRATPSAYNVERLCAALGCPASELVNVYDM